MKKIFFLVIISILAACTGPTQYVEPNTEDDKSYYISLLEKGIERTRHGIKAENTVYMANRSSTVLSTQYFDGLTSMIETKLEINGKEILTRTIGSKDSLVDCKKIEEWTCKSRPVEKVNWEEYIEKTKKELSELSKNISIKKLPSRTIVGIQTSCFKIDMAQNIDNEACLSREGIPLYQKIESSDMKSEMKATFYTTDFSDEIFDPPVSPESS